MEGRDGICNGAQLGRLNPVYLRAERGGGRMICNLNENGTYGTMSEPQQTKVHRHCGVLENEASNKAIDFFSAETKFFHIFATASFLKRMMCPFLRNKN